MGLACPNCAGLSEGVARRPWLHALYTALLLHPLSWWHVSLPLLATVTGLWGSGFYVGSDVALPVSGALWLFIVFLWYTRVIARARAGERTLRDQIGVISALSLLGMTFIMIHVGVPNEIALRLSMPSLERAIAAVKVPTGWKYRRPSGPPLPPGRYGVFWVKATKYGRGGIHFVMSDQPPCVLIYDPSAKDWHFSTEPYSLWEY